MPDLKDKVVIITGGAKGIGRACCFSFGEEGAKVVFTYYRSEQQAVEVEEALREKGVDCLKLKLDVRDYNACCEVVRKTLERFKKIDVLVNNAGIVKDRALVMMTTEDWKEVIDTNLGGTFNMTRACITTFLKAKNGCIINISSISGIEGIARQTNYSASKAGIIGFSKALAKEVAGYNIRVNVVCPGYINTEMVSSLKEDIKKKIVEEVPVKRVGEPSEVAGVCVFLASSKADYITGEIIRVDGGM